MMSFIEQILIRRELTELEAAIYQKLYDEPEYIATFIPARGCAKTGIVERYLHYRLSYEYYLREKRKRKMEIERKCTEAVKRYHDLDAVSDTKLKQDCLEMYHKVVERCDPLKNYEWVIGVSIFDRLCEMRQIAQHRNMEGYLRSHTLYGVNVIRSFDAAHASRICLHKKKKDLKKLYIGTNWNQNYGLRSTASYIDEINSNYDRMMDDNTRVYDLDFSSLYPSQLYCAADVSTIWKAYNYLFEKENNMDLRNNIKNVIFNDPATIVLWKDGTKTVVKAEDEAFDPEKGLAMAIARKALGNKGNYYDIFEKWLPEEQEEEEEGIKWTDSLVRFLKYLKDFNNGLKTPAESSNSPLYGISEQNGTPTPDNPIDISTKTLIEIVAEKDPDALDPELKGSVAGCPARYLFLNSPDKYAAGAGCIDDCWSCWRTEYKPAETEIETFFDDTQESQSEGEDEDDTQESQSEG